MDVWEFYDLEKDPQELNNLITSEEHKTLIEELKKDLYKLKEDEYENKLSVEELREISNTDFGGLESNKKSKK
jgi:hypothetical protein